MQSKMKDGSIMVAGTCGRDAELKYVGEHESRVCTVGVMVGRNPPATPGGKTEPIWCNVKAWHGLASILSLAKKGDSVFVVGRLEEREYNGKRYQDLVAEYLDVASIQSTASKPASYQPPESQLTALKSGDDELPF